MLCEVRGHAYTATDFTERLEASEFLHLRFGLLSTDPRLEGGHVLRLLGPKTKLYKAFGLF